MKKLELDYIGIDTRTYPVLYHNTGDYSVIFKITNCVKQFCANEDAYMNFHDALDNIIRTLGTGYTIQKHDIFSLKEFQKKETKKDFLQEKYFEHFNGRIYRGLDSYLTITKNETKNTFWKYDAKEFQKFNKLISKVNTILIKNDFKPKILDEKQIEELIMRCLSCNFSNKHFKMRNFKVTDERIYMGEKTVESISVVNIDRVDMPTSLAPFRVGGIATDFPSDEMGFLSEVPDIENLVYHQVIQIPNQRKERIRLEAKKKKHSSIPDPGNDMAVEDIDNVLRLIEKENELLVYCHFNIQLFGKEQDVFKAKNFVENELFNIGIRASDNSYNQKELFMSSLPGNTCILKHYDLFFTTSDPALSLLYKEARQKDENSHFLLHFTDRQGIPVAIDPSEKPRAEGRISNMNKFLLGPSGTGKSFTVNSIIRQYMMMDTEVVLVDVGHSYSGLCNYLGGRYITYTDKAPIAMNPFRFNKEEYNTEKKDFLKGLIGLLWKGAEGSISQVEDSLLLKLITEYYELVFSKKSKIQPSFNTFFEFSCNRIKSITKESELFVEVESYVFVLQQFYKGGEYDQILNSEIDSSLFDEKFIVFEIDNIKDNKKLFPIITLIIMDVFLQKMRLKKTKKALIIEEAWKAIANPMMAEYIKYVYKTVRKFNGEAMLVTQELDDILGNEIIKNSIISNSDTIILMDQERFKDNYDEVASLLNINEVERRKIFTINKLDNETGRGPFKETYFKRGATGEIYGIEESLYSYFAFTTERKEKELVNQYADTYNTMQDGLINLVKDLKESGLSQFEFVEQMSKRNKKLNRIA